LLTDSSLIAAEVIFAEPKRKGSIVGHKVIERDLASGHTRIFRDYFAENPVYPDNVFRRRFRISRNLFAKIESDLVSHDDYFQQKANCTGKLGASSLQKITAALRMLAYGAPADIIDEYVRMGESTIIESFKRFNRAIIEMYGEKYLRKPTEEELMRIAESNAARGFPGCIGSIDCMHWRWKNCPKALAGQFKGYKKDGPTVVLEAVVDQDLTFWHAFFGLPGSLNDLNVLEQSPLLRDLFSGKTVPRLSYKIGEGDERTMGYYLADGIYPEYPLFVKSIKEPRDEKSKLFAKFQEACRKDVERAFGVLQARFAILKTPARFWFRKDLLDILYACIILHEEAVNEDAYSEEWNNIELPETKSRKNESHADITLQPLSADRNVCTLVQEYLRKHAELTDKNEHFKLKQELKDFIFQKFNIPSN
jgi:hypothetical protein